MPMRGSRSPPTSGNFQLHIFMYMCIKVTENSDHPWQTKLTIRPSHREYFLSKSFGKGSQDLILINARLLSFESNI